jgi:hypothetical protein
MASNNNIASTRSGGDCALKWSAWCGLTHAGKRCAKAKRA